MGVAVEVVLAASSGLTGGGFEALTPGTGDTFTVRTAVPGSKIHLEEVWAVDDAGPAQLSIKSPNFHDQVKGLLLEVPDSSQSGLNAEEPNVLMPGPLTVPVRSADTWGVEVSGTAGDNFVAAMLLRYENLEGADAQLISAGELAARLKTVLGILVQPTNGACDYGSPVALNSVDPRLNSGSQYAILGAIPSLPVAVIGFTARSTGNYRVAMPGTIDPVAGGDYFVRLSQKYQSPHIPVFRGFDSPNVLVDTVDAAAAATPDITVLLAELV